MQLSWTKVEDRSLVEQVGQGKDAKDMVVLGRSAQGIYSRIKRLRKKGLELNLRAPKWSEDENAALIRQIEQRGIRTGKVRIANRTATAVKDQVSQLRRAGLVTRTFVNRGPARPWNLRELNLLKELTINADPEKVIGGVCLARSGYFPNRTVRSLSGALERLRKKDPGHKPTRNFWRLKPGDKKQLRAFLSGGGRHWPTADVAERFGYKADLIGRYRKRWKLTLKFKAALYHRLFRKRHEQMVAKRREALKAGNRLRRTMTLKHLVKLAAAIREVNPMVRVRVCRRCNTEFPASERFFRVSRKRSGSSVKTALTSVCLACPRHRK